MRSTVIWLCVNVSTLGATAEPAELLAALLARPFAALLAELLAALLAGLLALLAALLAELLAASLEALDAPELAADPELVVDPEHPTRASTNVMTKVHSTTSNSFLDAFMVSSSTAFNLLKL